MTCYKCGSEEETRPYGPRGEAVCFKCAFATPEAKATTDRMFQAQLTAAGPVVVLGEECGPRPLQRKDS